MEVTREFIEKMIEEDNATPRGYLPGMIFNIHDREYVLIAVKYEGGKIPIYNLISLHDFNRRYEENTLEIIGKHLVNERAIYLGRVSNIGAMVRAFPKEMYLMDELAERRVNGVPIDIFNTYVETEVKVDKSRANLTNGLLTMIRGVIE